MAVPLWGYALALIAFRLWMVWPRMNSAPHRRGTRKTPVHTFVVLGSGGHTGELLPVVAALDRAKYTPRTYVVAHSDAMSANKVAALEGDSRDHSVLRVFRAREVGQSYASSIGSTLKASAQSVAAVFAHRPQLVLCNGPAICVPLAVAALLLRFVCGADACRVVFVESGCRVATLSLTAKLLYHLRLCDAFFVQWQTTTRVVAPEAQYIGRTL